MYSLSFKLNSLHNNCLTTQPSLSLSTLIINTTKTSCCSPTVQIISCRSPQRHKRPLLPMTSTDAHQKPKDHNRGRSGNTPQALSKGQGGFGGGGLQHVFDVCNSQRRGLYIVLTSEGKVAMQASKLHGSDGGGKRVLLKDVIHIRKDWRFITR